jgi:hypothetical protein
LRNLGARYPAVSQQYTGGIILPASCEIIVFYNFNYLDLITTEGFIINNAIICAWHEKIIAKTG